MVERDGHTINPSLCSSFDLWIPIPIRPSRVVSFRLFFFFIFVQLSLVSILFIMLSMVVATLRAFANLYFEEISVVFFYLLSCLILLISDVGLGYFYHSLFHYWGFSFFEEISGGFAAWIVQFS